MRIVRLKYKLPYKSIKKVNIMNIDNLFLKSGEKFKYLAVLLW